MQDLKKIWIKCVLFYKLQLVLDQSMQVLKMETYILERKM